jgi:hypothetical protein
MKELTPDHIKRIDTRAQRQRYKDTDGEEGKLSLYIRIGTSTLYDWQPAIKSTLKEIAFMRVQGAPAGTRVKPRDPSRKTINYEDWCWASEKTLAQRSGCSERSTQRHIAALKKDGVIEVRTWRDKWGHQHNEYKINEQIVDDNQRPDDGSRARCEWKVRKPNSSWFSKTNQPKRKTNSRPTQESLTNMSESTEATRHLVRSPNDTLSVAHPSACPSPTRHLVGEPTDKLSVEGVDVAVDLGVEGVRRRARTAASQRVAVASLQTPKPKPNPQPVTMPEPLPLTPEETCAVCGGFYLDCNHKSGTLGSPLVAIVGPPAPAAPPPRAAFEVEEDLA